MADAHKPGKQNQPKQNQNKQNQNKQTRDVYAERGKQLTSLVQRLRGWIGSDPTRAVELADVLIQLGEHRLLGHGYAAAAADAQDAVKRAAELLTANGPIGPYTAAVDAARYITAVVHLASVQVGIGMPDAAGRTMGTLPELRQQLADHALRPVLSAPTAIWALACSARAALAGGDVAQANSYADATLARLADSPLRDDPEAGYLALDADRLASDCRWAADRPEESLGFLHAAKDRYDAQVGDRIREPGRLSPALAERLSTPLFGLYRDLADRLRAAGETDLGLVTRRTLVERLRALTRRIGDPARQQLASALADLADDLLAEGRIDEATEAAEEAYRLVLDGPGATAVRLLVAAAWCRALVAAGRPEDAVTAAAVVTAERAETASPAYALALRALVEAQQAAGLPTTIPLEEGAGEQGGAGSLRDLARGVVSRGDERVHWEALPVEASFALGAGMADPIAIEPQATADWLATERAEAHRLEAERLSQSRREAARRRAEEAEAERIAAERKAADQARAEASALAKAERLAAAEEADRQERKRRREERLEEHRKEAERLEAEQREAATTGQRKTGGHAAKPNTVRPTGSAKRGARAHQANDALAEAERRELARLETELAELERAEAERAAAERDAAERDAAEREAAEQRGSRTLDAER